MPKRRTIRKAVRVVHLWLGLTAGLVLSVVGITGSLYIFEAEIAAYLERDHYRMATPGSMFSSDIEMAAYVEKQYGGPIESIQWPKRGRDTYIVKFFGDDHWYYFDQSTGTLTDGGEEFGNNVFAFILDVHRTLTLGETGHIITGIASALFALFMLTTGLYLWWPKNRLAARQRFWFRWKASTGDKRKNYDIHNISGFYFFLPLFLMGLTGTGFYFGDELQWVINQVTFSQPSKKAEVVQDRSSYKRADFLPIEAALQAMNRHYPDYKKRNIWMTNQLTGNLSFAYQKRTDIYPGADTRIFLQADPVTGEIVGERHPDKLPRGEAIMAKWLLQVHFGEFGGLATRLLWFFAGWVPALLTYTGVKIWLGRNLGKKKARSTKHALTTSELY
ncbi:MAG: PepSY-associated TM helix domain-containing protein [Bacteroidota bacterium]